MPSDSRYALASPSSPLTPIVSCRCRNGAAEDEPMTNLTHMTNRPWGAVPSKVAHAIRTSLRLPSEENRIMAEFLRAYGGDRERAEFEAEPMLSKVRAEADEAAKVCEQARDLCGRNGWDWAAMVEDERYAMLRRQEAWSAPDPIRVPAPILPSLVSAPETKLNGGGL